MHQQPYGYPPPQGHYQHPPPKKPVWPWIIVGVVGFFALVGIASGKKDKAADGTASSATATATTTAAAKATAKPPTSDEDDEQSSAHDPVTPVTAAKLLSDYDGNEVRGDNAWKGKTVEVTGIVESIDKGPFGGLYVVIGDGDEMNFHTVHVNLKKSEESRAANLNKGEKRTFRGKVLGYTLGSVSVRDAVMVK